MFFSVRILNLAFCFRGLALAGHTVRQNCPTQSAKFRTIVPHFPYYRSLGLLGNLFQNKGLAHFSVSSLRISKILYGASQPSCCAARLLRAGKVVRPSQDGKFGKTERGLPEIVESPRAFSFRRAFPLSRFFERPNLAGRRKREDVAAIWMHAKN